jgi:Tol biopolymer transport system component
MKWLLCPLVLVTACASTSGGPASLTEADQAAQRAIGAKVQGTIVWSSARLGNHDLFVMKPDGSGVKQITRGDNVDWFPRFSPDGSRILFCRSKKGWVYERDANSDGKWDIWTVTPDGQSETKVVDNASWGSWLSDDEIVYVRGTKIFRRKLAGGDEVLMMTSENVAALEGALLQQPEVSRDGRYIAVTLRGSKRETGIWDLQKKTWTTTGEGCQINWKPDGQAIYWVHPTGNGGSRVLSMPITGGKPGGSDNLDQLTFMDLPGRRSHEYFPQLSSDGKWMVWAATQRGHDHDTADYEIYIWEVGSPPESAARLTFEATNDRWPDIFIPSAVAAAPAPAAAPSPAAEKAPAPAAHKTPARARSKRRP